MKRHRIDIIAKTDPLWIKWKVPKIHIAIPSARQPIVITVLHPLVYRSFANIGEKITIETE